ncbi:MAG TPA: hypothetical protein VH796_00050 [Nitrososphaeraceae archaeon]
MSNDLITASLGITISLIFASSVTMTMRFALVSFSVYPLYTSMNVAKAKKDLRNPDDCNSGNNLNNSDDVGRSSV